jgi:uncharacterized protein with NRDE domain
MCTLLLRYDPAARWPVLAGAVRDEFVDRAWDPPAAHWPPSPLLGGRDRVAGGTWLAVDPVTPGLAALLNGVRLPVVPDRPSRGGLPLAVLTGAALPDPARYDGYHLLRATPGRVELSTWDGVALAHRELGPGEYILVNDGLDAPGPMVAHFAPLLARACSWPDWVALLDSDGLDPADPRALLIRRTFNGRTYGSTSVSLVGLSDSGVRYEFRGSPLSGGSWVSV